MLYYNPSLMDTEQTAYITKYAIDGQCKQEQNYHRIL